MIKEIFIIKNNKENYFKQEVKKITLKREMTEEELECEYSHYFLTAEEANIGIMENLQEESKNISHYKDWNCDRI